MDMNTFMYSTGSEKLSLMWKLW